MTRESPRSWGARLGRAGEEEAARYYVDRGFVVVARNLRTRLGEIDLLVRRRRLYVAVEVKTRALHPAPERLVTGTQLNRVERALLALVPGLRPRARSLRIDVVAVTCHGGRTELRHFPARGPYPPRQEPES